MGGKIRKIVIGILALCITGLFSVPIQAADAPEFRLGMNSLNLQKGVSSSIVVSMVNAQGATVIDIEGLEHFNVLSQSQSTSTSIVGSEVTYQIDFYYTVMPKATGTFTLKANVQYNNQLYETNTLDVTISEGSADEDEAGEDLFVKTILSQDESYLGEKIIVTYNLYSRYNIENFGFTDYTAIDGMVAKSVPDDQLKAEYVYLDGIQYAKYEVKQLILDPIKSGVYTIPAFNLQVSVITNNSTGRVPGGFFGGLFSFSETVYLQTETKELTVKPLPSEGKPANFSGIVGELQVEGHYSRDELDYGDSLTLQVTASGNCNLDGFKNIFVSGLQGFTVYETQKNTEESLKDNQYNVQKTWEAILVPEETGILNIAPVSISYFSPNSRKYEKVEIPGTEITVLGDMPIPIGGSAQTPVVETVFINQVNYADTSEHYFTVQLEKRLLYGVLIGFIGLLALGTVGVWLIIKRKKQDTTLESLYRQLMNAKDKNVVYDLFNDIIKHCYSLSLKSNSQSAILNSLPNAELAVQVTGIMDYMESSEEKALSQLKDKIKNVYRMIHKV